jgi:hypothetical protein
MKRQSFLLMLLMLGCMAASYAQGVAGGRSAIQQARIRQGLRTGEITPREAVGLEAQQAHIHREKRIARADGVVTPAEHANIAATERRASRNIYFRRRDMQRR